MTIDDDIDRYFEYFAAELLSIRRLGSRRRLHKKILLTALIAGLSSRRYPLERDRKRFGDLVTAFADWPSGLRVGVPMVLVQPALKSKAALRRIRRAATFRASPGEVVSIETDPLPLEVLPNATPTELAFLEQHMHRYLLCDYRSTLVHEFREAGHGFEFDQREVEGFYFSVKEMGRRGTRWELTYPLGLLVRLTRNILRNLKADHRARGVSPYEGHRFGSPWAIRS